MLHRRHLLALAITLAAALAATNASADEPVAAEPTPAARETEWYGYQTIATDAAAVGLASLSHAGKAAGAITYLIAAPVIHVAHGSIGKGVGDLGIRLVSPLTGALAGLLLGGLAGGKDTNSFGVLGAEATGAAYGLIIGAGLASALDATVLARREVSAANEKGAAPPPPARDAARVRVLPTVSPSSTGATAGVVGTF
jgi:hypothetical protein